jgi:hypothetical protein
MKVQFPEQYKETIERFILDYFNQRRRELEGAFPGIIQIPSVERERLFNSELAADLALIASAAAGELKLSDLDEVFIFEIVLVIQDLMERLFSDPLTYRYNIPERFWTTPLGKMVAKARLRLSKDELIPIKEAAELLGVSVQAISRAVKNGRLTRYVDPDAPERQGRTLVSRREVEAMKERKEKGRGA